MNCNDKSNMVWNFTQADIHLNKNKNTTMKKSIITFYLMVSSLVIISDFVFSQNCLPSYSCQLTANAVTSSFPCASGGNVTVNAANGTAPYTYVWLPNVSTTNNASNLAPGSYSVTVIDASTGAAGPELVINGDFSAGNTGFTSSYSFCTQCCNTCLWPDATFAVGNNPQWYHSVFYGTDHTTGTGNMMIINGASVPNVSVWCETINVIPNTNYVFSTWMAAMNTISAAQLQFEINGVPIGNIFSAPNQTYLWNQFCATWNSGNNTTANICIINQSTVIYGNDFALDDISFRSLTNCSTNVVVNITQPPGVLSGVSSVNASCYSISNGSATVTVNSGTPPYNFLWNTTPVQTSATANNLSAGNYSVSITDANGCTSTQSVTITQPPAMNINASATPASCGMNDGTAIVSASGGASPFTYLWLTSPVQVNTSIANLSPGTYSVIVTDANGCAQQQSVVVSSGGNQPIASFFSSEDTLDILNPTVYFTDNSSNAYTWMWYFGDGTTSALQNPSHTYSDTGKYCISLVVTDINGVCIDSTVHCLEVLAEFSFYIPNAFTPNGDWNNEFFFGKSRGVKNYTIRLFDRWGNLIWDCHQEGYRSELDQNSAEGLSSVCKWNGKVSNAGADLNGKSGQEVQEDVYVWKVELTDIFNKEHKYIGHVSVVK